MKPWPALLRDRNMARGCGLVGPFAAVPDGGGNGAGMLGTDRSCDAEPNARSTPGIMWGEETVYRYNTRH
jgi:hypothetical protein